MRKVNKMISRAAAFVAFIACGTTTTQDGGTDAASDADSGPARTTKHDCSPACGIASYCAYPIGPGICPMQNDAGFCPAGCAGCPPLGGPMCKALPAACNGTPSCACLVTMCPQCGPMSAMCSIDADGDFVISCLSC